ncbi:hypothetical protein AVEN_237801-1 [Araneus ventricosus]|uniref:RNase H type-1 domain-containing protein n=1 Tax=Araneus ventricosus TaxID=182803 RepID=A0A4Y2RKN1_ARAVE|nr:hypothetical protein AVEN_237801-1 [Araneus ventricosus]
MDNVYKWCTYWNISISPEKSAIADLSKRRLLSTPRISYEGSPLPWKDSIKYSGIIFSKTNQNGAIVKNLRAKALRKINALKTIAYKSYGPKTKDLVGITNNGICSLFYYSCTITNKLSQTHFKICDTVQTIALRVALGLPIWTFFIKQVQIAFILPYFGNLRTPGSNSINKAQPTFMIKDLFEETISEEFQDYFIIATDASKSHIYTSIAGTSNLRLYPFRIHPINSIFTAEALAICQAINDLSVPDSDLLILTDSFSILQALKNLSIKSPKVILRLAHKILMRTKFHQKIALVWTQILPGMKGRILSPKMSRSRTYTLRGSQWKIFVHIIVIFLFKNRLKTFEISRNPGRSILHLIPCTLVEK